MAYTCETDLTLQMGISSKKIPNKEKKPEKRYYIKTDESKTKWTFDPYEEKNPICSIWDILIS